MEHFMLHKNNSRRHSQAYDELKGERKTSAAARRIDILGEKTEIRRSRLLQIALIA